MAKDNTNPGAKALHWFNDIPRVKPGSPEHAVLLAGGYGLTVEDAKEIVASRKADPNSYSLPELRKAEALLQAFNAKPKPTSTREMWHRPLPAA
jgi:hypothetical protein